MNLHEIQEAIRELEQGSCTYNNCMKLASLYIIRDEMQKKGYDSYNYRYRPIYERREGRGGNSSSSYGYREPMYYTDDLMIGRQHGMQ